MLIRDIQKFEDNRYKTRTYMSYILIRNLPDRLPDIHLESVREALNKIAHDVSAFDALYILDSSSIQIENAVTLEKKYEQGAGEDRSSEAYFYRVVRLKCCILSDSYPSILNNELCVTASMSIYDDKEDLLFAVCIDIKLRGILRLVQASNFEFGFLRFSRLMYFCFASVPFIIICFLFQKGSLSLFYCHSVDIQKIFEGTIAITLALATFDLAKTIIKEEVLGRSRREETGIQRTMVRLLGSIIIALAIRVLMPVFKLTIGDLSQMVHVVYLICGITLLLAGLGVYILAVKYKNNNVLKTD